MLRSLCVVGQLAVLVGASLSASGCHHAARGSLANDRPSVEILAAGVPGSGYVQELWISLHPCRAWDITATIEGIPLSSTGTDTGHGCGTLSARRSEVPELFELATDSVTLELSDSSGAASVVFENIFRAPNVVWTSPSDGVVATSQAITLEVFPGMHSLAPTAAVYWQTGGTTIRSSFVFGVPTAPGATSLTTTVPSSLSLGTYDLVVVPSFGGDFIPSTLRYEYAVLACNGLADCSASRGGLPNYQDRPLDVPLQLTGTVSP